jgi:hypothetical protein
MRSLEEFPRGRLLIAVLNQPDPGLSQPPGGLDFGIGEQCSV